MEVRLGWNIKHLDIWSPFQIRNQNPHVIIIYRIMESGARIAPSPNWEWFLMALVVRLQESR